jgi:hypothetical protein
MPCVTFGEETHLILIFKNLIENIHKHSKGSLCYIFSIVNKDNNKLKIFFIDNGETTEEFDFQEGLMSVNRSTNICRGTFNICNIQNCQSKKIILNKFTEIANGTVAEIALWLLNKEEK